MGSHPLVLGAWVVAILGAVLFTIGRRGRLVSRAEFCRKCGHETTSAGPRCPECGTPLGVTSMRLAFELNHPILARIGAVTRRGRRAPRTSLVAWGCLALFVGLGIGAGVPALRLARVDWNRFRATESLLVHAQSLKFDDPRYTRIMGVLTSRNDQGRLSAPQAAVYQQLVLAHDRYKMARLFEQYDSVSRQPVYAYIPPRTHSVAPVDEPAPDRSTDTGGGTAGLIDAIRAQLAGATDDRSVQPYQPPPLAIGYAPPPTSDLSSLGIASLGALPLDLIVGDSLPDARAFSASAAHMPRINPATGLAPRGSLTGRAAMPVATGLPSAALPTSGVAVPPLGATSLQPTMVRTSTFNNPLLAPGTLTNRPLSPVRISNAFGR